MVIFSWSHRPMPDNKVAQLLSNNSWTREKKTVLVLIWPKSKSKLEHSSFDYILTSLNNINLFIYQMGEHFQDAKQWYLMERSLQFYLSAVYMYTDTRILINCFVFYIILFLALLCFSVQHTCDLQLHDQWALSYAISFDLCYGEKRFSWESNIRVEVPPHLRTHEITTEAEQNRRRIRVGPPEHECLKFTMMMMIVVVVVVRLPLLCSCVLLRAT